MRCPLSRRSQPVAHVRAGLALARFRIASSGPPRASAPRLPHEAAWPQWPGASPGSYLFGSTALHETSAGITFPTGEPQSASGPNVQNCALPSNLKFQKAWNQLFPRALGHGILGVSAHHAGRSRCRGQRNYRQIQQDAGGRICHRSAAHSRRVAAVVRDEGELIMAGQAGSDVASLVSRNEQTILPEWIELQKKAGMLAHRPHLGRRIAIAIQEFPSSAARRAGARAEPTLPIAAYEPARAMLDRTFAVAAPCRAFLRAKPPHSSSRSSSRCSMR